MRLHVFLALPCPGFLPFCEPDASAVRYMPSALPFTHTPRGNAIRIVFFDCFAENALCRVLPLCIAFVKRGGGMCPSTRWIMVDAFLLQTSAVQSTTLLPA